MGKNSEVTKLLLVFVLVVLLAIMGYSYVYVPQREKLNKLVEENFELEKNMIILQNKTRDEAMYKEKINASKEAMTEVMNRYAAGHTPEKSIMLVDTMVNEIGIELPNISFGSPSALTNVQMPIVKSTEGETGEASYTVDYYNVGITSESLSMSYKCTYEQMKKFVDFLNAYPERMNISSVSVSYDSETGNLSGSLLLNLYAVTGTDKQYVDPEITDIRLGDENIFGNVTN